MLNQHINNLSADADLVMAHRLLEILNNQRDEKLVFSCDPAIYLNKLPESEDICNAYWAAFEVETLTDSFTYLGALGANVGLTCTYNTPFELLERLGISSLYRHANANGVACTKNEYFKYYVACLNGSVATKDICDQAQLLEEFGVDGYLVDVSHLDIASEADTKTVCGIAEQLRQVTDLPLIINIGCKAKSVDENLIQVRINLKKIYTSTSDLGVGIDKLSLEEYLDRRLFFDRVQQSLNTRFLFTFDRSDSKEIDIEVIAEYLRKSTNLIRFGVDVEVPLQVQLASLYTD